MRWALVAKHCPTFSIVTQASVLKWRFVYLSRLTRPLKAGLHNSFSMIYGKLRKIAKNSKFQN